MIAAVFLTVFSAGCAGSTPPAAETKIPITPSLIPASVTPVPTKTVIVPTETASPTPAPTPINYFDLSPEERLERSKAFVAQADDFSGEVFVPVELNGQVYRFFWSPNAVDRYESGLVGAWKPENSKFELDRTGETLPPMVVPGYENEDGTLVVIDPRNGQRAFYANQVIPALGGEISYRDLYAIPQNQLSDMVTEAALSDPDFGDNAGVVENFKGLQKQSLYLPVILWGAQTSVFAHGFDNGGGAGQDVPEARYSATEALTNNGLVPVNSPETGDFMFFINIMVGDPVGQYNVFYRPDGSSESESVYLNGWDSFGMKSQDKFGIIAQSRFPRVAHSLGGGAIFSENSPVMGNVDVIEQILNASSEKEILGILNKYRLLLAYPSIVYRPDR
jgi:hypothetical protein